MLGIFSLIGSIGSIANIIIIIYLYISFSFFLGGDLYDH